MKSSCLFRFTALFVCLWAALQVPRELRASEYDQRVINLSGRAKVGTGNDILVAGFFIADGAKKPVLIRAIGPTLTKYNVTGVLANPQLRLFNSSGLEIAGNDDWSSDSTKVDPLNAAFTATSAFKLTTGTRDAALLATLEAGAYTTVISGVGNTTGNVLFEIYDVSGSGRFINLSSRALIDATAPVAIAGLVIAPGPTRHVLIRAVGPTLVNYGITNPLPDPMLDLRNVQGATILTNDNWGSAPNAANLPADFTRSGAFPLPAGSLDAAVVTDLEPGNYTVLVSGKAGSSGIVLMELYDLSPEVLSTVSVNATVASTDTSGSAPGVFTFTRSGVVSQALTVPITFSGSAVSGSEFLPLPSSVTFAPGATSVSLNVNAMSSGLSSIGGRSVTATIDKNTGYGISDSNTASVTIFYNPGSLFLSNLRPSTAASGASVASGTATIQLSPDESFALVSVSFSNLSSPEVTAHLAVGVPGVDGPYVLAFSTGQVSSQLWGLSASGSLSSADIKQALKEGRVYVSIDSSNFPTGELRGQFIQSAGSLNFTAPAEPPALADAPLTAAEAGRFLVQSTFGPTKAEIDALTGKRRADLAAWLSAQIALPASAHRTDTMADFAAYTQTSTVTTPNSTNRYAAWWKIALNGQDQLRQRVGLALSEIFVVSDQNNSLVQQQEALANYQDLMAQNAFGTYRALLEKVALSPVMGFYLSHLRNRKVNPTTGAQPDENFAREIMQLFSIGLNQLQPDGTLKLSPAGLPIATYDNATITEMAKVFTGFSFYTTTPGTTSFTGGAINYINPMSFFTAYHEDGPKTIVTGKLLPANQGGLKDLADTLDTLASHPNTAPFISRQLIQKLVTSNPSPGYVYRVARVFEDNGSGVRGDLGAVVTALLLDNEARSSVIAATTGYGKLKEPLLRSTALLRGYGAAADNGRYAITSGLTLLAQAPLGAPTVFNFFEPGYVLPGTLASFGLVAPEFQILTDTTALTVPNFLYGYLYATRSATAIGLDLASLTPNARQPDVLADRLNTQFCGGTMPTAMRARIISGLNAMPAATTDLERVRSALYLVLSSPESAIQK